MTIGSNSGISRNRMPNIESVNLNGPRQNRTSESPQARPDQFEIGGTGTLGKGQTASSAEHHPTVQGLEEGKMAANEEGLAEIKEMLQQLIEMLMQLLEGGEAAGAEGAAGPEAAGAEAAGAESPLPPELLEELLAFADRLEEAEGGQSDLADHIRSGVEKVGGGKMNSSSRIAA